MNVTAKELKFKCPFCDDEIDGNGFIQDSGKYPKNNNGSEMLIRNLILKVGEFGIKCNSCKKLFKLNVDYALTFKASKFGFN